VSRHEAGPYNRLTVTNGRIDGGNRKDPLLKEALGESESLGLATDQDRHDRTLGGADFESDGLEPFVHLTSIAPEHLDPLRFGLHDLKGLKDTTDHGWGQGSREDEATCLVLNKLDHLMRTGDKAPHRAKGLGKRAHDDLDIIIDTIVMDHAAPLRPHHAKRMSLVNIHDGAELLGCFHHRWQISHIAGHTKNAIHDDETS